VKLLYPDTLSYNTPYERVICCILGARQLESPSYSSVLIALWWSVIFTEYTNAEDRYTGTVAYAIQYINTCCMETSLSKQEWIKQQKQRPRACSRQHREHTAPACQHVSCLPTKTLPSAWLSRCGVWSSQQNPLNTCTRDYCQQIIWVCGVQIHATTASF